MLHATSSAVRYCVGLGSCAAMALCTVYIAKSAEQDSNQSAPPAASGANPGNSSRSTASQFRPDTAIGK